MLEDRRWVNRISLSNCARVITDPLTTATLSCEVSFSSAAKHEKTDAKAKAVNSVQSHLLGFACI
jgi:hypothetical protein